MKYFSLFSGAGGFELAIDSVYENYKSRSSKQLGESGRVSVFRHGDISSNSSMHSRVCPWTCVGFSEIDKYAISVYQKHYQTHKNYGDITKIDWNTVPDFDLVVGGSPCQDLSVAGKQKGLAGTRSGLFFEFIRCLKEKQPTNFIWENVKGALSSSSGWDFARVQIEFSEAGYDYEWQVLNAKDFGVPQNRERIFVVGHLRGKSEPKIFPIRSSSSKHLVEITQGVSDAQRIYTTEQAKSLKGLGGGLGAKTGLYAIKEATKKGYAEATVGDSINFSVPSSKTRRGRVGHGVAQTLDTASNQATIDGSRIRRLTPLECERLMSWPDNWTKIGISRDTKLSQQLGYPERIKISDTQRYKMCGNGVVSKVAEVIIEKLYSTNA